MKAQDVKVGMVVWDKQAVEFVKVISVYNGRNRQALVTVSGRSNRWEIFNRYLRPLTAREKGLTK